MGNDECCEDKAKGGEFHRSDHQKKKIDKQSFSVHNLSQMKQSVGSDPSNKRPINTKSTLPRPGYQIVAPKQRILVNQSLNDSFLNYVEKENNKEIPDLDAPSNSNQLLKQQLNYKEELIKEEENGKQKIIVFPQNEIVTSESKPIPSLNQNVKKTYQSLQVSSSKGDTTNAQIRQYGGQVYFGQIQSNIPNGFGKFYKKDEALYVGYFQNGKAEGTGVYIFPDGSYFEGFFKNNQANCTDGEFQSDQILYRGGFQNNQFHGTGAEHGPTHKFEGIYSHGFKSQGSFQWYQNETDFYVYQGTFNEKGLFHGKGKLIEPTGVYEGDFFQGKKHGQGTYQFKNGIRYQGHYFNNIREGPGKLINPKTKKVAYQGHFQQGLPHGQGYTYNQEGKKYKSRWTMGLNADLI